MNLDSLRVAVTEAMDEMNVPRGEREAIMALPCSRCGTALLASTSVSHMVTIKVETPMDPEFDRVALCGRCATDFAEFIHPELLERPTWVRTATEKRAEWMA